MSNNMKTMDYEQHKSSGTCVRFYLKKLILKMLWKA